MPDRSVMANNNPSPETASSSSPSIFTPGTTTSANSSPAVLQQPTSQQQSQLNPRSCTTCRRRKVKCDKRYPCSNCVKQHIPCVFPERNRAPRRPRKPPDNELLKRLAKLEGVVEELSGQVVEGPPPPGTAGAGSGEEGAPGEEGRLVIDAEGRSRYISSGFWASLYREFDDLRSVLVEDDSDNDYPSPSTGSGVGSTNRDGFIFGQSSLVGTLREYHPSPEQIEYLWQVFSSNIDPVLKIVHRPTFEKEVLKAKDALDTMSRTMETLMFSMYFAAITSLTPEECTMMLGEEKTSLLDKYRWAVEQALARAGFLDSKEMGVLQAFAMFLICVRRHTESRRVWTLTGIAIRIAQSLGLHRDGSLFNLPPFETEMRRRLWWQITMLDLRSSEEDGSDPSLGEYAFDTHIPLNINDSDISPDTTVMPTPKEGCTEMTFCVVRFETCSALRRLNNVVRHGYGPQATKAPTMTLKEKVKLLEDTQRTVEEKYLRYCDMSVPLNWVSVTVIRLIMAKIYLLLHQPFSHPGSRGAAALSQETRDTLFQKSCDVIEYSHLIKNESSTVKWGWLFRTYVQWHAVAFILSELCVRTEGPDIERAWRGVDVVFREAAKYEIETDTKRAKLWRPLDKLFWKARKVHQTAAAKRQRGEAMGVGVLPAGAGVGAPGGGGGEDGRRLQYWRALEANLASGAMPVELTDSMAPRLLDMTMEALDLNLNPFFPGRAEGLDASAAVLGAGYPAAAHANGGRNGGPPGGPMNPLLGVAAGMDVDVDVDLEGAEDVSWDGWETIVKDFQMEVDRSLSEMPDRGDGGRGIGLGGRRGAAGGGDGLW